MTRWATIRKAIGAVKGAPADAIEDTAALYDGELGAVPFRHYHTGVRIPAVDIAGTPQWWRARREERAAIVEREKEDM